MAGVAKKWPSVSTRSKRVSASSEVGSSFRLMAFEESEGLLMINWPDRRLNIHAGLEGKRRHRQIKQAA